MSRAAAEAYSVPRKPATAFPATSSAAQPDVVVVAPPIALRPISASVAASRGQNWRAICSGRAPMPRAAATQCAVVARLSVSSARRSEGTSRFEAVAFMMPPSVPGPARRGEFTGYRLFDGVGGVGVCFHRGYTSRCCLYVFIRPFNTIQIPRPAPLNKYTISSRSLLGRVDGIW